MIKKLLFSIGILFSFFLMFLFGFDKINVLAYSDIENALGSYPVKLDINNYNRENLLDIENLNGIAYIEENIDITFENGKNYFYCATRTSESSYSSLISFINTNNNNTDAYLFFSGEDSFNCQPIILNVYGKFSKIRFYASPTYNQSVGLSFSFIDNMVVENVVDSYSKFFKFGYNVNYSLSVNNLTSSQVNAGISIIDNNGNYLKTGNCVIPASSSTICNNLNDPLYLSFSIDNNGYISFDYSLGLFIGPVGSLSISSNDSGLNFVPVFNAYYKDAPTNNLYFKDKYTFNNLFLSGFNVSVNSSTLSDVIFGANQFDSSYSMNSNNLVNFATNKKIETGIYNYINYVDFIDSSPSDIYSFVITTGVSSPVLLQDRSFTISFSYLSLRVNGDIGNVAPLPNNPNTINKYNVCSSWYDIPCQLGNGLTYVIYDAPIISPVLIFIVSFITMFSSLVSFVDLFKSFGIVFGCFIIYMFINLLHKYSK